MRRADLVSDAGGYFGVSRRTGHILPDWPRWNKSEHDRLKIFLLPIGRDQERGRLASSQRSRDVALEDAALFDRTGHSERITSVQAVVPKQEVEGAVVFLGSRFREDLDAAPSGT